MNDIFQDNPNLKFLSVVLVSASFTGVLVVWEFPYNPLKSLATTVTVSASVPPNEVNSILGLLRNPPSGPPGDVVLPGPEGLPFDTVATEEVVQADVEAEQQDIQNSREEVRENSPEGTAGGGLSRFVPFLSGFGTIGGAFSDKTLVERLQVLLAKEVLTEEEIQEAYAEIDEVIAAEQDKIDREALVTLQIALIVFAAFLTGGAGLVVLV